MGDDRGKIMEKRSSMRGWHERGGKKPRKKEVLGIALIAVIFLAVMASALIGTGSQDPGAIEPSQKKTPTTTVPPKKTLTLKETPSAISLTSIPAPSIRISSPQNITYDTSTPSIDFTVVGSNLDVVLLTVDEGENQTIPHDGLLARIEGSGKYEVPLDEPFEDQNYIEKWSSPGAGFTASIDSESYSGERSLKVTTAKTSRGWSWISTELTVTPGAKYEILTHVKADNIKGTHIAIDAFDGSKWSRLTNVAGGTEGTFDWSELSKTVDIPKNVMKIRVALNAGWSLDGVKPAVFWFDAIKVFPLTRVQTVEGKNVLLIDSLGDALHNLTIFANNTAGNASSQTIYFTVNVTEAKSQGKKISGIKETISKGGLSVTLERFDIYKEIYVYPSTYKRSQYADTKMVSTLTIIAKNTGDVERPFKLDPDAVILDGHGNQYGMQIYRYMKNSAGLDDQIEQKTIYPGVERGGVIYFEPNVKLSAKKVTLFLYLNGEKYEFVFNPFM